MLSKQKRFRWLQAPTSSASTVVLIGGFFLKDAVYLLAHSPRIIISVNSRSEHKFAPSLFHSRISKLKVPCIVLDDSGVTGTREGGRAGGCRGEGGVLSIRTPRLSKAE